MSAEKSPREYIMESFKNFYTILKSKFILTTNIVNDYGSTSANFPLSAAKGTDLNNRVTSLENVKNQILWDGGDNGHLLGEGKADLPLSAKISEQRHGIVLVFALRNSTGKADSNLHSFYVPKNLAGSSYDCSGIDPSGKIFVKHIYLYDTKITSITSEASGSIGNCACNLYGPSSNHTNPGGNWISDAYALKYVIGV